MSIVTLVSFGRGSAFAFDGTKRPVGSTHLAVRNRESEACWTDLFRNLFDRGLRMPTTVTSDGVPGLVRMITFWFPAASFRVRGWFIGLNIRAKLPDESASGVMAHVYAVRDAPTIAAARAAAEGLINTYRREFPAAFACFGDGPDALLAIHRVPFRHRIRTTNMAERSSSRNGDARR